MGKEYVFLKMGTFWEHFGNIFGHFKRIPLLDDF
jgi:hypothetical protein